MSSSATFNGEAQIGPNNIHDQPSIEKPFLHRIPSFIIPTSSTPLLHFSGVPFSWEHCPGIPKKMDDADNNHPSTTNNLLPLPPAGNIITTTTTTGTPTTTTPTTPNLKSKKTKKETAAIVPRDPFLAAIVECSRDDDDDGEESGHREINFWKGSKALTRTLSDRFGFISMYTASCKQRCPVSDSIVYIARPAGGAKYYQRRNGR